MNNHSGFTLGIFIARQEMGLTVKAAYVCKVHSDKRADSSMMPNALWIIVEMGKVLS